MIPQYYAKLRINCQLMNEVYSSKFLKFATNHKISRFFYSVTDNEVVFKVFSLVFG